MKRMLTLALSLFCMLSFAGCGTSPDEEAADPGTGDRGGRPYAAYIADDVTKAEITHILGGQTQEWTAEGEMLNALRDWAAGLKYEHKTYAQGQAPGDLDGGEVYSFVLTEGDYPGFSYIINGPADCHLLIEGEWFTVSNPSDPPITEPFVTKEIDSDLLLKDAPDLLIQYGEQRIQAMRGTTSWHYMNPDGTSTGIEADSLHPLTAKEYMPVLPAAGGDARLEFDIAPDEITVRAWPVSQWGNMEAIDKTASVAVSGDQITLLEGGHIYEIFAKWSRFDNFGGSAHYSFCTSPLGVTLTAKDVTPTGLTLVCTQSGGKPTGVLQTGSPYWLEIWADGYWERTPIYAEITWTMEAWTIPKGGSTQWTVNWENIYFPLPAGRYRIGKEIMDFRGTGDYDEYNYYAEFTVE